MTMDKNELLQTLNGHEWTDVEFKAAGEDVPKSAYETVSAFSNTKGGRLLFGVGETTDGFEIVGVKNVDRVQNDFLSALKADNKVNHDVPVTSELITIDGKTVLVFSIEESSRQNKPVYLNGDIRRTFIRRGGGDQRCSMPEIERFLRDATGERWDGETVDIEFNEAIDRESLKWYRALFNERNPGHSGSPQKCSDGYGENPAPNQASSNIDWIRRRLTTLQKRILKADNTIPTAVEFRTVAKYDGVFPGDRRFSRIEHIKIPCAIHRKRNSAPKKYPNTVADRVLSDLLHAEHILESTLAIDELSTIRPAQKAEPANGPSVFDSSQSILK
jgi:hypothetical protein